jgi:hypothetical protein
MRIRPFLDCAHNLRKEFINLSFMMNYCLARQSSERGAAFVFLILQLEGQTGVPLPGSNGNTNTSRSSSLRASMGLLSAVLAGAVAALAMLQRKSMSAVVLCVAIVCASALPSAFAPSAPQVELTLNVPNGYTFGSVTMRIADGSLLATGPFNVRSASLDLSGTILYPNFFRPPCLC